MNMVAGVWFVLPKTLLVYFCVVLQVVQGMKYIGCFKDEKDRDLSGGLEKGISNNTPENCVRFCQNKDALYAAVQNGNECFCGNSYGKYGEINGSECNSICTGDRMKKCGGHWANSIYEIGQHIICNLTVLCWSDNNQRKDCPVHGAAQIINVKVIDHNCGRFRENEHVDDVYEISGATLSVKNGCTARFSVCYTPVRPRTSTVVLTTKQLSSSSTTFVTDPTHNKKSSTSATEPIASASTSVKSSLATTHRHLPNSSTATSYTTNSHMMEPDNTTTVTVVSVVIIVFICICLVVLTTIILFRRRHLTKARSDRTKPLDEETYTMEQQSSEYSNALPMNETVTNSIQRSTCLTEHGSATSNSMLDKEDKDFKRLNTNYTEGGAGGHSYFILEHQNQRESYVENTDQRTSTSESQEIYYNEPNRNEVILTMKTVKSDAEYNTIKEVPRKFIVDPNYDTLGISKEDTELQENYYYCHTTDNLRKLNNNVVDYSHIHFQNVEGKI